MAKILGFVGLWLAGSAAAVAIAWAGVSFVGNEVINPAPANNLVASASVTVPTSVPTPTQNAPTPTTKPNPTSAPTPAPTAEVIQVDVSAETSDQIEPAASVTAEPASTTVAPTPMPISPTPEPTVVPVPTATPPSPAQTLTFNLIGGSTAISFSATGVHVLWATPDTGFAVSIEPESSGVQVEFRADNHRSRIDAWWSEGPQTEIREEAED